MGLIAFEIEGHGQGQDLSPKTAATGFETIPFRPFMLLEGDALRGWKGEAALEKLDGRGAFNHLALFPDLKQLEHAKFHLQKKTGKAPSASDLPYWYFSDPLQQFLLLSGKTHFWA